MDLPTDPLERLLAIMARLRGPDGCPWDREQSTASLRKYVLEEAYEVADAIDCGDWETLRHELGDLLLQVVFLARIAEEQGRFAFADVARAIGEKLERRHPHVFADAAAHTVEQVWRTWEGVKAEERAGAGQPATSRLDGIPRHLPALAKARLLADKAARAGFDWPSVEAIADKIQEEVDEVRAALAEGPERTGEEVGDVLFATASLARRAGLDPEACLEGANRKFAGRFRHVEAAAAGHGLRLEDLGAAELDTLWNAAKEK